jgi:hypothetical protein
MPESPRTRFRRPRAASVTGDRSRLTGKQKDPPLQPETTKFLPSQPVKRRHRLILKPSRSWRAQAMRGRKARLTFDASCWCGRLRLTTVARDEAIRAYRLHREGK